MLHSRARADIRGCISNIILDSSRELQAKFRLPAAFHHLFRHWVYAGGSAGSL